MKAKISVEELQYALRLVRDIVPTSGPLAEVSGLLVSVAESKAIFTAFNGEILIKVLVPCETIEKGEAVVEAGPLYSAISSFQPLRDDGTGTSDVLLSSSPKSRKFTISAFTLYKTGTKTPHERTFALKNRELFPDVPSPINIKSTISLVGDTVIQGIENVFYAASSDRNQAVFNGVLLKIDGTSLTFAATDGICLAESRHEIEDTGNPVELIVPGVFASKISKSFSAIDDLEFSITDRMLFVRSSNVVIGGPFISDSFPDYEAVLPQPEKEAFVDRETFIDNLVNLTYEAATVPDSRVSLVFKGGTASLVCGNSTNDGIPAEMTGNFSFSANLKLLLSSVKSFRRDKIKLGFSSPESPIYFFSGEKETTNLKTILVPLSE